MALHQKLQERKAQSKPISYADAGGKINNEPSNLDKRIVEGYGNAWNVRNAHGEIFENGAWTKSIKEHGPKSKANYKIKLRDEHGRAVGLMDELKQDDYGLYFRSVQLDSVPWADHMLTQIRSGTVNNFSNGFRHIWEESAMKYDEKREAIIISEGVLMEVSGVSVPSDTETYAIRSESNVLELNEEIEEFIINTLPRSQHVEARILFTRCMSLKSTDPLETRARALGNNKPSETGLDINYLISKLS